MPKGPVTVGYGPCSSIHLYHMKSCRIISSGYTVFLPRIVPVTPSGKLLGDVLQALPPGLSLGIEVTDGIFCKQKSVGKPQKYSWREN